MQDKELINFCLCDLPESCILRRLVRLAEACWKIERDNQQLKEQLNLDHYQGRGLIGRYHHVTLATIAHSFLTLQNVRLKNLYVSLAADPSRDCFLALYHVLPVCLLLTGRSLKSLA